MILFFLIFILIEFSFLTPVDTLNLAVRCSPSYQLDDLRRTDKPTEGQSLLLSCVSATKKRIEDSFCVFLLYENDEKNTSKKENKAK